MSPLSPEPIAADTHLVEVRAESYGYTLAHKLNGRVLYIATYENRMEAMRNARRLVDMEESEGHKVVLLADARLG